MNSNPRNRLIPILATCAMTACTGQVPNSFRLAQQEQTFDSQLQINTQIDLLWVVDNSSSMDTAQEKLREGFGSFARKYMQPTWDIRVAVISSDTFLAHPAFSSYLNTTISGTVNWTSNYVKNRTVSWVAPAYNPTLLNTSTWRFPNGIKNRDLSPDWGPNYAKLLPGIHDGPLTSFCFEGNSYFLSGVTNCAIRDQQSTNNGVERCLRPGSGQTSLTQCVNTTQNNTVRSGKAIISTAAPAGADLTAWTNQLIDDFMVNVSTGTSGMGSERGLGSVLQLLDDNEVAGSATAFFRPNSLRGIIFVSDEDDQTMDIENPLPGGFNPFTHYQCDQASLLTLNSASAITGVNGYCCTNVANNCRYGSEGTSCPSKTVDGHTYTPSLCPDPARLTPVANVKTRLDQFFRTLDGNDPNGTAAPNYFVASIVALTWSSIQTMQVARDADDAAVGAVRTIGIDRADRYIELGNLVGNGSLALDIGSSDYSPLLDSIGDTIITRKSTFTLQRAPTSQEDMIVKLLHSNGSWEIIPNTKYVISGKSIVITDHNLVLSFKSTDKIVINYQPKTVN